MPALPWTKGTYQPDEGTEVHVLTSRLPLRRYTDVPRFLMWTMRIRKQLRSAPGCAGYALDAKLLKKTFWTLSAWSDKAAMDRFVGEGAHAAMLVAMRGRVGDPKFVETGAGAGELPLGWGAARERIARLP